ncbi:hypothetical protein BASA50_009539 [Batrachochytrium salamandrivorans]|uniref:Protein kinase domain-containing protein n=1 Tax=Batrachochytrium salamandrivorans TaxID=1357716 RepID=A0ABQ8F189_9FUNG|nr:hypothetical protein BASA62_009740 [Batrachochytrium salamandrivorans]KAH6561836.1 hypothetical protein BASA60_011340 [Batrachochytrium salamandrivorans]KAH6586747.1 hypothetical protein BASA61_006458 [Batrachochytrium salamandrivorans]KAH6590279.1 hypothetical protein BASA50_009539 [Batrachochytrium salamandrivorans]KAH9275209.1 hypothetical protein BASA83_002437 [Batrachochytrium salamandrivorans]
MTSFVLDFAKSTLSKALGSQLPTLLFSIGPQSAVQPTESLWTLHSGIKKDDQQSISVFIFNCTLHKDKLALAQNALRRAKTIRHPDILRYIDGCETDSQIIIGTEFVYPLSKNQHESVDTNLASFGLYKLASALKFLTQDCSLIHANVRLASVFTTLAGEWKLGGLDFLSSLNDESPPIYRHAALISSDSKYVSPEVLKSTTSVLTSHSGHVLDIWGYSCLIYELFNGPFSSQEDLKSAGSIPSSLLPLYQKMRNTNPAARPTFEYILTTALLSGGYFDNDFVKASLFLEQFSLKDSYEKDTYFSSIKIKVESFPIDFCKFKILPELINALEFGGAGANALGPILKIGSRLDEADFVSLLVPIITKLFASPDRAVRVTLCESLGSYIGHLSQKIVSEKIFPNLATGFGDSSAIVRESTLKSVLVITPKLSERIINNDILRYMAKLQADEEPGIRTNTTICLGKISSHMSDTIKKKVLSTAFIRSLHDGFPPARKAGLMALSATIDYYEPHEISHKIIPGLSLLLIDSEKPNRVQAFKSMALFLKKLEGFAESMPETAVVPISKAASVTPDAATSAGAGIGGEGWAGWAISAVSARIATSMSLRDSQTDDTAVSLAVSESPSTPAAIGTPASSRHDPVASGEKPVWPENSSSLHAKLPPMETKIQSTLEAGSGWDDNGWDMDESLPTSSLEAGSVSTTISPMAKPSAPVPKSSGWDSWSDDWTAQNAPTSINHTFANPVVGVKATVPAAQQEEERKKRREALAIQREARKASRLGVKKT